MKGLLLIRLKEVNSNAPVIVKWISAKTSWNVRRRGSVLEINQGQSPTAPSRKLAKTIIKRLLHRQRMTEYAILSDSDGLTIIRKKPIEKPRTHLGERKPGKGQPRGLRFCPHCGKASLYAEEYRTHLAAHYV